MNDPTPQLPEGGCEPPLRKRPMEIRFAAVTLLWAILFVASMRLVTGDLLPAGPIPWLVAALPSLAAIYVVSAFVRFLGEADELQRLIQLQALALGFAGGFFAICGYALFEQLGAPEAGVDLAVVMPLLYVIGLLIGAKRYR